jgi:hypothetical protein
MGSRKHCRTKRKFPSEDAAKKAMFGMKRRKPQMGWMDPYKCNVCGSWHFGHTPGKNQGGRMRRMEILFERIRRERDDREARTEVRGACEPALGED